MPRSSAGACRAVLLLCAGLVLCLAGAAKGAPNIYTRGVLASGSLNQSQEYQPNGPSGGPAPSAFSYTMGPNQIAGNVDYNAVRISSAISGVDSTKQVAEIAQSQGRFIDGVTINAAGLKGKSGTVIWEWVIEGSISASGAFEPEFDTGAGYDHQLEIGPVVTQIDRYHLNPDGTSPSGSFYGPNILNKPAQLTTGVEFGTPLRVAWNLATSCRASSRRGQSMQVNLSASLKIVKVLDPEGQEILGAAIQSESGAVYGRRVLWGAARDFVKNEKPDRAEEASATNAIVAQWSYGYRSSVAGTALTAFTPGQHLNAIGSEDIEGFSIAETNLLLAGNTGSADVILSGDSQPARPLPSEQMVLRPGTNGTFPVVRWTAPEAGTYNIAARWVDLDAGGGNGAIGHVLKNGVEIAGAPAAFDQNSSTGGFTGFRWENGGVGHMPPQSFRVEAGDTIDFVLASAGDTAADLTGFNAIVRRAPDVTIAAPTEITAGQEVVVTVANNPALTAVALRNNARGAGTDTTAPYEFSLGALEPGVYHLQAEGIDAGGVVGASNVIVLTVRDSAGGGQASLARGKQGDVTRHAAIVGTTYEAVGGFWSEPQAWRRQSDGAFGVGVPGPDDIAIIGRSFQIVLNDNVTVKKLYCEGLVRGDDINAARELTVTDQFSLSGRASELTINMPEGSFFTNVRGVASLENVRLDGRGQIVLTQSLFASGSDVTSRGSLVLQTPPANGGPVQLRAENIVLSGQYILRGGTQVISENGSGIISENSAGLVGADGAGLVGADGAGLVGADGAGLVGADGAGLVGLDGAGLVGADGAGLVGADGAGLGFVQAASILGTNGAGLTVPRTATRRMLAATSNAAPALTLSTGSTLSGTGNIVGALVNRGFVAPGASGGLLSVLGDYTQEEQGALVLEVGGTTPNPPQFDQLHVAGTASLSGKLIAKTINGFTPQSGQNFTPLSYNAVSGNFTEVSSNAQISFGGNGMTMQVSGANPPAPKALNIATRMRVETGDNVLIAGFIITGDQPKRVLVRGIGPSLPVSGALDDPTLDLDAGTFFNDDWRSEQQSEIEATTIPPSSDLESAIVATLDPGAHTAVLRGKNDGTGVGLVEVYDLDAGSPVQLANISTRGQVQTGDNVMIGGFIIGGNYPARVLLRAIGPSLPVDGALQDPTLELVDSNGATITNDNWRETHEAEIIATTVPPANDREAAVVATLVPGAYTAVVRGKDDTIGVALVEGYTLQ